MLLIAGWAEAGPAPAGPPAQALSAPPPPISGTLAGEAGTIHRFPVEGGMHLVLDVRSSTGRIGAVLQDSTGKTVREVRCGGGLSFRVGAIPEAPQTYTLELRGCGEPGSETAFELSQLQLRQADSRDRSEVSLERLTDEAESLVYSYRSAAITKAKDKFRQAAQGWRELSDSGREIAALLRKAELDRDLGDTASALAGFQLAADSARRNRRAALETRALTGASSIHVNSGNKADAASLAERSLEILEAVPGDAALAAAAYQNAGDVRYLQGESASSLAAYAAALEAARSAGDAPAEVRALVALAATRIESNRAEDFLEARKEAGDALAIARRTNDRRGQGQALIALSDIDSMTGHRQEGLTLLWSARDVIDGSGDLFAQAMLFVRLGWAHRDLGNTRAALGFYENAYDSYRRLDHWGQAQVLTDIGELQGRLGNFNEAASVLGKSIAMLRSVGNDRGAAYTLLNLGSIHEQKGDAKKALAYFNEALALNASTGDGRQQAYTLIAIGHLHENSKAYDDAAAVYREALSLSEKAADRLGQAAALYRLAYCESRAGRPDAVVELTSRSLSILERVRSDLASDSLRTSYASTSMDHYRLRIDALMTLSRAGAPSADEEAFEVSERSRARALLEAIAESRIAGEGIGPDELLLQRSLESQRDAATGRYEELKRTAPLSGELTALDRRIEQLRAELDDLRGSVVEKNRRFSNLAAPRILTLRETQRELLDDESLLVEFSLGESSGTAWALTRTQFRSYTLPGRKVVEGRIRRLRELLTASLPLPGESGAAWVRRQNIANLEYPKAALEISSMLFGPAAGLMPGKRIVIVDEGVLQYLPYGALPEPGGTGSPGAPLIVGHEIVRLPSASALAMIRQQSASRQAWDRIVAVFADPKFGAAPAPAGSARSGSSAGERLATASDLRSALQTRGTVSIGADLPPLLATRKEAEAIFAVVPPEERMEALGLAATKAAALDADLRRYRIVHLATHSILDDRHSDLSSLVLSLVDADGNPQDGFLRLRDIYEMRLNAELVVLSACETAIGQDVAGEGFMNMVRGFMYSGTPRVVASLWKVDDNRTAELMKEFYTQMFVHGARPAEALRSAQVSAIGKGASPFEWAGFQLQGEWK